MDVGYSYACSKNLSTFMVALIAPRKATRSGAVIIFSTIRRQSPYARDTAVRYQKAITNKRLHKDKKQVSCCQYWSCLSISNFATNCILNPECCTVQHFRRVARPSDGEIRMRGGCGAQAMRDGNVVK